MAEEYDVWCNGDLCRSDFIEEEVLEKPRKRIEPIERIELGTDGNPYKLTISNGTEYYTQHSEDYYVSRDEVSKFIEYIQSIKDKHIEDGLPINYGTICDILIRGYKLLDLPSNIKDM